MIFTFICIIVFVACTNAGILGSAPVTYSNAPTIHAVPLTYAASLAKAVITKTIDTEYDPHPQYNYAYDVQDQLTGDFKTQQETRDGDVVHGSYSVLESDGTRRVVHYTADDQNGFNAIVEKQPSAIKTVAAAPVVKTVAAIPVSYTAAPLLKTISSAPAVTYDAVPTDGYLSPVIKTFTSAPTVAYSAPIFKTYAAASPVIKTVIATPVDYSTPYAQSYANQYARTYSAPIVTKYPAAPSFTYPAPVAYNTISVTEGATPVTYSQHTTYTRKYLNH